MMKIPGRIFVFLCYIFMAYFNNPAMFAAATPGRAVQVQEAKASSAPPGGGGNKDSSVQKRAKNREKSTSGDY